jgi:rhodanese-related sulfurtransferase
MARWISKLTLNQTLGLVALLLGAVAVFASVYPGRTVTLHEADLLTATARAEDLVTPVELAAWLIEGRADYRLIDLRDEDAFGEYHIPNAENIPLVSLADLDAAPTEKIVLYATGDRHAAQAWMLLRGRGLSGASTLQGGLEGWKNEVLFPVMPENPSPEAQARFEKAAHVAEVFGGQPRASSAGSDATTVDMTALRAATSVAPPKLPQGSGSRGHHKTREGC